MNESVQEVQAAPKKPAFASLDEWDEAPKAEVKLCKVADPDCEACQ